MVFTLATELSELHHDRWLRSVRLKDQSLHCNGVSQLYPPPPTPPPTELSRSWRTVFREYSHVVKKKESCCAGSSLGNGTATYYLKKNSSNILLYFCIGRCRQQKLIPRFFAFWCRLSIPNRLATFIQVNDNKNTTCR